MYNRFFGFKERPFRLVPNPDYLYLSRVHEEVLAHLNYAVAHGEGFVEITGEVGTGKTTLCRMFLENLGEDTEAAYIFNPKLDALQLLKTINDEFGIDSTPDTIKTLLDPLNAFLLEKKEQGKHVILLIDEAQNLSADVLEQLRLLSNLETTTRKLLQIILVGQPELGELLSTNKLRQLNQRITLSCHLIPFNRTETREYIRHRLHIASCKPGLIFSAAAFRLIFAYTGGVPRRINIVCDRALLTAFTLGRPRITRDIVKRAVRELDTRHRGSGPGKFQWEKWIAGLVILLILLAAGLFFFNWFSRSLISSDPAPIVRHEIKPSSSLSANSTPVTPQLSSRAAPPVVRSKESLAFSDFMDKVSTLSPEASQRAAITAVLERWGMQVPVDAAFLADADTDTFFHVMARYSGHEVFATDDFKVIYHLNLPAVVGIVPETEQTPRFMALVGLRTETLIFSDGENRYVLNPEALNGRWTGVAYILWKNFHNYPNITLNPPPTPTILALKAQLRRMGFSITAMTPNYDSETQMAVETIQYRNGLTVDGIVGPQTKIVIYNEDSSLTIPHLTDSLDTGS